MPFTDPMADGPAIQAVEPARAEGGHDLAEGRWSWSRSFRARDADTPVVLMGYYNPIYAYGVERFLADAEAAGVDGLIIVDLPPEEDEELVPAGAARRARLHPPGDADDRCGAAAGGARRRRGLPLLRLGRRHHRHAAGRRPSRSQRGGRRGCRRQPTLPVAVGFGIRTPEQAAAIARVADAAVVGSALVDRDRAEARRRWQAGAGRPRASVLELVRGAERPRPHARGAAEAEAGLQMNWLTNFVRPKIQAWSRKSRRRTISGQVPRLRADDLPPRSRGQQPSARNAAITCGSAARSRFELLFDDGAYQRIELPQAPTSIRCKLPRPQALHRPAQGAPRHDRRARRLVVAHGQHRRHARRSIAVHELRLHGRLAGHGGGRGLRRRGAARGRRRSGRSSSSSPPAARACRRASSR